MTAGNLETRETSEKKNETKLPIGYVLSLILWLLITLAAFGIFYILLAQTQSPEQISEVIRIVAWPFAAIALAFPLSLLLVNNITKLLLLRDALQDAPKKLQKSIDQAEQFQKSMSDTERSAQKSLREAKEQLDHTIKEYNSKLESAVANATNNIASSVASLEDRASRIADAVKSMSSGTEDAVFDKEPTTRDLLSEHLDIANNYFGEHLESWNSDGRRTEKSLLIVKPGGGNRPYLVTRLQENRVFDQNSDDRNSKIAEYLKETFEKVNSSRRGTVTKTDVSRLNQLRSEAGIGL